MDVGSRGVDLSEMTRVGYGVGVEISQSVGHAIGQVVHEGV